MKIFFTARDTLLTTVVGNELYRLRHERLMILLETFLEIYHDRKKNLRVGKFTGKRKCHLWTETEIKSRSYCCCSCMIKWGFCFYCRRWSKSFYQESLLGHSWVHEIVTTQMSLKIFLMRKLGWKVRKSQPKKGTLGLCDKCYCEIRMLSLFFLPCSPVIQIFFLSTLPFFCCFNLVFIFCC